MTTLDGGVIIKKGTAPAPPSGGDEWQYYDVANNVLDDLQFANVISMFSTIIALSSDDGKLICGAGIAAMYGMEEFRGKLKCIGINMDIKQCNSITGDQLMSFKEVELAQGASIAAVLASFGCSPITEAEFYDLNA